MILLIAAAAPSAAPDPAVSIGENAFKFVVGPLVVVAASLLLKTISDIRTDHLTQVRLVKAMQNELDSIYRSLEPYTTTFAAAYDGGSADSVFAHKVAADPRYFPYSVANRSATAVFVAETAPARTFNFLRSEVMATLVAFHDPASLLHVSVADMREDIFRDLPAARKLDAIGNVVELLETVQAAYEPCRAALERQDALLTSRSALWLTLFPIRSGSYPFWILVIWILGNMLWQSMAQ